MNDFPGRSIQPQRAASLSRFREKRKERCFDKKIRYSVRKEVALRYYIVVVSEDKSSLILVQLNSSCYNSHVRFLFKKINK